MASGQASNVQDPDVPKDETSEAEVDGAEHPPADALPLLSPGRRAIAWFTLSLFVVLFMPAWLRSVIPR